VALGVRTEPFWYLTGQVGRATISDAERRRTQVGSGDAVTAGNGDNVGVGSTWGLKPGDVHSRVRPAAACAVPNSLSIWSRLAGALRVVGIGATCAPRFPSVRVAT